MKRTKATVKNRSERDRADRKNMIQACKNLIVADDFHGILHRDCEGTEQIRTKILSGLLAAAVSLTAGTVLFANPQITEGREVVGTSAGDSSDAADDLVEFIDMTDDSDYLIEDGFVNTMSRAAAVNFSWTVQPVSLKSTSAFKAYSGDRIRTTCAISPTDLYLYMGIIEPDGVKRCVYGCSALTHAFLLDQTGQYRVYVRNPSKRTASLTASYTIY